MISDDGELKEELDIIYTEKVWSEIDDSLKKKMKEMIKSALAASQYA